jgi:hypothetical protein
MVAWPSTSGGIKEEWFYRSQAVLAAALGANPAGVLCIIAHEISATDKYA